MLSLRCPSLPVFGWVHFVEAIQDPRHLLQGKQPESQMVEVVIDAFSVLLTTYLATTQLGSCVAQHRYVNRCKDKK